MQRVPHAANAVLVLVVATCLSGVAAATPLLAVVAQAATVAWPPSSLVVSEVQTGGAGASDEFVEVANQGAAPIDLIGLEIVYATSSGSTVTRKATWAVSAILAPGRRFLLVNGAGVLAPIGDAVYTGGFAATGGSVALRVVGGSVVDSVGWGDATNAFVEGVAAPAPAAGSSLERRPGGALGNGVDSNDNLADWTLSTAPGPQGLTAPPIPDPGMPSPSPTEPPSPTPLVTPEPSVTATPSATPPPTVEPTPSPTPAPTPTPPPTPEPTPAPTSAPMAIADARSLPDGSTATVAGVLTTDLGTLEAGRSAFIQDATGGIALYLDATVVTVLPAGTIVAARGSIDDRFAQRTLRIAESDIVPGGAASVPAAADIPTGAALEAVEARRIRLTGTVTAGPDALADGTAVTIDDGSGPVRVVITPTAMEGRALAIGSSIIATGPLGQRDSSGTGLEGYRAYVTHAADLSVAPPTPTPSPSPTGTSTPSPTTGPTPSPSASIPPTASPSPSVEGITIADARSQPVGSVVTVRGVVIAEPGRLGSSALVAIADASGGIVVKIPAGAVGPTRGRSVAVTGPLADPYGQLEVRPSVPGLVMGGSEALPAVIDLGSGAPSEATEARLVRGGGIVVARPSVSASGDVSLTLQTSSGARIRVMADSSSGISRTTFVRGARYRVTGVVGQRASKKGELDGYRVWVRDRRDVSLMTPAPTPTPSGSRPGGSSPAPRVISIAAALRTRDRAISVQATVTTPASILDGTGRRIVVQDASGAIEVLLPKDTKAPAMGTRLLVTGEVGTAYGAPRLRATAAAGRGVAAVPAALRLAGPVSSAHTWRLVAISGRVEDVRKLGDRWRAEIVSGRHRLVVVGQPGARIPVAALIEGRVADIVGIVRPAYPSATDRRPSVLPRSASDVRVGPATGGTKPATTATAGPLGSATSGSGDPATDADLIDLISLVGSVVRVGGLVVDRDATGFLLDDGTATGRVDVTGPAAEWLDLIEPGDAINVTGRVVDDGGEPIVIVDDPATISLGSALDGIGGAPEGSAGPSMSASPASPDVRTAGIGGVQGLPGAAAGIVGLVSISAVSLGVAVLRRRRIGRLLAGRFAATVASIGRHPPA